MKRDLDLIRSILLKIEEISSGQSVCHIEFKGIDSAIIAEHIELLEEAKLIIADLYRSINNLGVQVISSYEITRLTMDGHDFIASIKIKSIWDKVKSTIEEKGGEVPFHVVKVLAANYMSQFFGIS